MKIVEFIIVFVILMGGINFISAEVSWGGSTDTQFITGGSIICQSDATVATWIEDGIPKDASTDCYREEGVSSTGTSQTSCCPAGETCGGVIPGSTCLRAQSDIVSCNVLSSESECNKYGAGSVLPQGIKDHIEIDIAKDVRDANGDALNFCDSDKTAQCLLLNNCRCDWNSRIGKCQEKYDVTDICPESSGEIATCRTTTNALRDMCAIDNVFVLNWTSRLVNSTGAPVSNAQTTQAQRNSCKNGQKTFPCPSQSDLPFFGLINFIIAGLMIGGVYLIWRKNKLFS